jgi:uncharacterized protein YkwD
MATKRTKRTKRLGIAAAALAIAGIGAACAPSPPPAPPAAAGACGPAGPPDATTSTIYNLTNASRGSVGLGGLAWNRQLYCLASEWSANMGAQGRMYHRDLNSVIRSPEYAGYRTLGENVLYGPASMSGQEMHNAWMNSAGHRANILSGAFTSFAVALAYPQGPGGTVWATENFGG